MVCSLQAGLVTDQYSPETHCPWTVTAELHPSQFPHCMESQVSLLSLAPHLGVSKGTLGLHILQCCSFNSQDTFCCTKFLLIIQVAFEEEFHLLWCQAQVYDPFKDVPAKNQSDSNHCVGDSTQYKPCTLSCNKEQKVRGNIQGKLLRSGGAWRKTFLTAGQNLLKVEVFCLLAEL